MLGSKNEQPHLGHTHNIHSHSLPHLHMHICASSYMRLPFHSLIFISCVSVHVFAESGLSPSIFSPFIFSFFLSFPPLILSSSPPSLSHASHTFRGQMCVHFHRHIILFEMTYHTLLHSQKNEQAHFIFPLPPSSHFPPLLPPPSHTHTSALGVSACPLPSF